MAKTQFLQYFIHLTDKALVDQLTHDTGIGGDIGAVIMSPLEASVTYNAPIQLKDDPLLSPPYPSITSDWIFRGSDNNFPKNQRDFTRCTGGWWGICWLFGEDTHFYWRGAFVYAPGLASQVPGETVAPLAKRRWIDGFEIPDLGEGGTGGAALLASRGASRHLEGYGLLLDSSTATKTHTPTESGGSATKEGWERFYVRFRRFHTAKARLWKTTGATSSGAGLEIGVLPTGQLTLTNIDSGGTESILGSTGVNPLNSWIKIDVLYRYGPMGGSVLTKPIAQLHVNGVLRLAFDGPQLGTGGLGQDQNLSGSVIGSSAANTLVVDVDDWIGCDPQKDGSGLNTLFGTDWHNGSHVTLIGARGFAASHSVNWGGDWRLARQRSIGSSSTPLHLLASSTGTAKLALTTDAAQTIDTQLDALGVAALTVGIYSRRAGVANGRLGYKLPGGSDVLATITQGTALQWNSVMYHPSGVTNPLTPLAGLELIFEKDSAASLASVQSLYAVAEVIGVFGDEDLVPVPGSPTPTSIPRHSGIHNAPYPRTPWAHKGPAPFSPVVLVGGTYTGTDTFVDLTFRAPVHWLLIRSAVNGTAVAQWFSTMVGPHRGGEGQITPEAPVEVLMDPAFPETTAVNQQQQQTIVRIVGNAATSNALGVAYQYIAICDPGMRFIEAGALHNHAGSADLVTGLANTAFVPEAVFLFMEEHGDTTTGNSFYKGPGHATAAISPLSGAEVASGLEMAAGTLTYKSGLASTGDQAAVVSIRRDDHSGDPGIVRVFQLASYTGDGSASRTVGLAPASGKRPLFAMVVPHNAASVIRDPSHTGTTSMQLPATSLPSTGISGGGIDSISVGSALNANSIVYDVFVIPGSDTACNGGFGCNGEFIPVEPTSPDPGTPWDITPPDPELPAPTPPPTNPPGGLPPPATGTDWATQCIAASTALVNQSLARIGISTAIVDLSTEQSPAATVARLHYNDAVTMTLRDFPWPFATKYATLALVGGSVGTPANADWIYSYRQPSDCAFERRIVVARGTGIDPTPPPFQLSSDATGGLIFTNQASAVLEYTYRPTCAAGVGDPLFREALGWRMSSVLAPPLSRMKDTVEMCDAQYRAAIKRAEDVIRPGNPGTPPAAATVDTTAPAIAANLAAVNLALVRIGAQTIANLTTEQSREATAARLVFESQLRGTLRDVAWPFATKYVSPTLVAGPAPPANSDWLYSYRQPADSIFERRIVASRAGAVDPTPPPFQLSTDATGVLILTNQAAAVLEYTARVDGVLTVADPLFLDGFAWRLAASLAPSLAQREPERPEQLGRGPEGPEPKEAPSSGLQLRAAAARMAWDMYQATIATARAIHKPGVPGTVPAAGSVDLTAPQAAANTTVVNRALVRIGAHSIPSLASDQSREAASARLVFEEELKATLRDFPWPFATRYATLAVITGPAPPHSADWLYAYRQPADCVFERRLVTARGSAVDPPAAPFTLSSDATGGLILTNVASAVLEYTARPDGVVAMADSLFKEALSWRLVAALAPSLSAVTLSRPEQQGRGPDDRDPETPTEHPTHVAQRHTADAAYAMKMYWATLAQAERVLSTGKPGAPPAAATIDTAVAAAAANTAVVNRALIRIGAQSIVSLATDQSREAVAGRAIFEDELRSTLRDFPWAFATAYAAPTLVAGTSTVPVNNDWQYSYRAPTDVLFLRRITRQGTGRRYDPNPAKFKLSQDATGGLLYTDEPTSTSVPLTIEYTTRPDGAVLIADALFRDAFAWRLAASLAPSLAQIDPSKPEQRGRGPDQTPKEAPSRLNQIRAGAAKWAWQMYLVALSTAEASNANEQEPPPDPPGAEWIVGRN